MDEELEVVDDWETMDIKAIPKKGPRRKVNNKRGLFLPSNIGKVYEKVIKKRNRGPFIENITEWQTGGVEKRAPIDIVMMEMAVIEHKFRTASIRGYKWHHTLQWCSKENQNDTIYEVNYLFLT